MATLRAAAFILNIALLVVALFLFAKNPPSKADDLVVALLVTCTPIVNMVALSVLSRGKHNGAASLFAQAVRCPLARCRLILIAAAAA